MNSIQEKNQQIERMLYRGKILINEARRQLGKPPLYDLAGLAQGVVRQLEGRR